ncbi:Fur family transcriptional regulator [Desulfonatronovibrio magnus]|uniref:Fur family transcriptional regulator n=1 Tax=Desulfonatronovibrio magnus TaxID=698827 RepID=UPI0005EB77B1|nr:Fur family transcriptional regulator [Desulfonatronovibrio magnus]
MRLTKQRKLILHILQHTVAHPTATEIYDEVRKKLPNISLGTVYRNLDVLSRQGYVRKIDTCGDQNRFDGVTDDHLHIICTSCGKVRDVEGEIDVCADNIANLASGFKVTGFRFEVLGACQDCQNTF